MPSCPDLAEHDYLATDQKPVMDNLKTGTYVKKKKVDKKVQKQYNQKPAAEEISVFFYFK